MFRRSNDTSFKVMGVGIGTLWLVMLGLGGTLTGTIIWAIYHLINTFVIKANC